MHVSNGVVFAVAGSKGGVGKTTTSINLSAVLAEAGYDVVLVEVDLAMANVGDFLDIDVGLEGEDPTLHEVLAGTATVVDATYDSPCVFDVVPSGATLRGYGDADVGRLSEVLSTLRFAYDVVVLDTGAGVTAETVLPLAVADETILVSSPRVASVRDTMKTRDIVRQVGGTVAGVVFVRSGTGRSPGVAHIADFLAVELLGHVPEDGAVPDAQDVGLPVVVAASESEAAAAYRTLGDRVAERVDALKTSSSGVLSAERTDSDGSGFAFVDRPATGDEEMRPKRGTDDAALTTNGRASERADDAVDEILSLTRTNGGGPNAVSTPKHDPGDTDGSGGVEPGAGARELADAVDDAAADTDEGRPASSGDADGGETTLADDADEGETTGTEGSTETVESGDWTATTDDELMGGVDDAVEGAVADDADETDEDGDTADADEGDTADSDDADGVDTADDADQTDADQEGTADDADQTDAENGDTADGGTEPTDSSGPDGGETNDRETDDGETKYTRGTRHDSTEATRSAPRRFLDRAIGLVDRGND